MATCPVCEGELTGSKGGAFDKDWFDCPRCRTYCLSFEAKVEMPHYVASRRFARAILSHAIYRMSSGGEVPQITSEILRNILENSELPSPREQLENFIVWLGRKQELPGNKVVFSRFDLSAIGAESAEGLLFVVQAGVEKGLVTADIGKCVDDMYSGDVALTLAGWDLYAELLRGKSASRTAFMAMQFGNPDTEEFYRVHLKDAVKKTGFELKRLDEGQPAGLIDDRLRVEIRQARFLVADLTDNNRGAYWEAGFAEGLGKPVIYTCRRDSFDAKEPSDRPHFDTNHHLTVVWDRANLDAAMRKLKDTIRATLPEDAKMEDGL